MARAVVRLLPAEGGDPVLRHGAVVRLLPVPAEGGDPVLSMLRKDRAPFAQDPASEAGLLCSRLFERLERGAVRCVAVPYLQPWSAALVAELRDLVLAQPARGPALAPRVHLRFEVYHLGPRDVAAVRHLAFQGLHAVSLAVHAARCLVGEKEVSLALRERTPRGWLSKLHRRLPRGSPRGSPPYFRLLALTRRVSLADLEPAHAAGLEGVLRAGSEHLLRVQWPAGERCRSVTLADSALLARRATEWARSQCDASGAPLLGRRDTSLALPLFGARPPLPPAPQGREAEHAAWDPWRHAVRAHYAAQHAAAHAARLWEDAARLPAEKSADCGAHRLALLLRAPGSALAAALARDAAAAPELLAFAEEDLLAGPAFGAYLRALQKRMRRPLGPRAGEDAPVPQPRGEGLLRLRACYGSGRVREARLPPAERAAEVALRELCQRADRPQEEQWELLWLAVVGTEHARDVELFLRRLHLAAWGMHGTRALLRLCALGRFWAQQHRRAPWRRTGFARRRDDLIFDESLRWLSCLGPPRWAEVQATARERTVEQRAAAAEELRKLHCELAEERAAEVAALEERARRAPRGGWQRSRKFPGLCDAAAGAWRGYCTRNPEELGRRCPPLELLQRCFQEAGARVAEALARGSLAREGAAPAPGTLLLVAGTFAQHYWHLLPQSEHFEVLHVHRCEAPQGGTNKALPSLSLTRRALLQSCWSKSRPAPSLPAPEHGLLALRYALSEAARAQRTQETFALGDRRPRMRAPWGATWWAEARGPRSLRADLADLAALAAPHLHGLQEAEAAARAHLPEGRAARAQRPWDARLAVALRQAAVTAALQYSGRGSRLPVFLETLHDQLACATLEPLLVGLSASAHFRLLNATAGSQERRFHYTQRLKTFAQALAPLCRGPATTLRLLVWLEGAGGGVRSVLAAAPWRFALAKPGSAGDLTEEERGALAPFLAADLPPLAPCAEARARALATALSCRRALAAAADADAERLSVLDAERLSVLVAERDQLRLSRAVLQVRHLTEVVLRALWLKLKHQAAQTYPALQTLPTLQALQLVGLPPQQALQGLPPLVLGCFPSGLYQAAGLVAHHCEEHRDLALLLHSARKCLAQARFSQAAAKRASADLDLLRQHLVAFLARTPEQEKWDRVQRRRQVEAFADAQRDLYRDRPRPKGVLEGFGQRIKGRGKDVRCWTAEGEAVPLAPWVLRALRADLLAQAFYSSSAGRVSRGPRRHQTALLHATEELARDVLCAPQGRGARDEDGCVTHLRRDWQPDPTQLGRPLPPLGGAGPQLLLAASEIAPPSLRRLVAHAADAAWFECLLREDFGDGSPSYLSLGTYEHSRRALEPLFCSVELAPLFAARLRAEDLAGAAELEAGLRREGAPVPAAAVAALHFRLLRHEPGAGGCYHSAGAPLLRALRVFVLPDGQPLPQPWRPPALWDEKDMRDRAVKRRRRGAGALLHYQKQPSLPEEERLLAFQARPRTTRAPPAHHHTLLSPHQHSNLHAI